MDAKELLEGYAAGGRYFPAVKLSGAKLKRANLKGADLLGAELEYADLECADLERVQMEDSNLRGANLEKANLRGTQLTGANLSDANLRNADLSISNVQGLGFTFGSTNLSGADLSSANLNGADLNGANLSSASLHGTSLIETNLTQANLQGAKLCRANLAYAQLNEADLTNADLSDANLAGTDLTKAQLSGAKLNKDISSQTENSSISRIDWTAPLRSLQADFIQRIKSGHLLNCGVEGQHSELTIISGETLKRLIDFCWVMAEKYKQNNPVRKVLIDNMKGKLGEEVVKIRLTDFVTEVDYEKRLRGDGKVDFRMTSNPAIGIQVKSRYSSIDRVQWTISQEEVQKNAILICIFSQEEFDDRKAEYNLVMAGFLPTNMIQLESGKASVGINQLMYSGGLRSYLEFLALTNL
jgi:uncharacterized protein YjbI with pentapeptide repeats